MSQEIVEAVRALAREKGISEEKLITALEDALLSAYKKQPGAVRYARVRTRGEHDGRKTFTGELLNATDDGVTVAADTGVVSIAYADIHRSNLVGD